MSGTIRAVRAPLVLGATLLIVREERVLRAIALSFSSEDVLHKVFYLRLDYWLYPVNVIIFASCVLAAIVLLEAKQALFGPNRGIWADALTGGLCLAVAGLPALLSANIRTGRLQLLFSALQIIVLWTFMLANAGLWLFHRSVAGATWFRRLTDVTFPVSDLFFHLWYRRRIAGMAGRLRFVPVLTTVAVLSVVLGSQTRLVMASGRAEKVPVPVDYTYFVAYDDEGFWFSASGWAQPWSGLWRYDEPSGRASQLVYLADAQRFHVEGRRLYAYDRARGELLCVDGTTGQVVWRTPLRRGFGTVEVTAHGELLFATAEGGYIAVVDKAGTVRAARVFPFRTRYFQPLTDGRVAFVAGDPSLRIWDAMLTHGEKIPFPLSGWRPGRRDGEEASLDAVGATGSEYATAWSEYDATRNVVYLATVWGKVFRYDVGRGRWLPSIRVRPGVRSIAVDPRKGLLFAASYYLGVIDVVDLETGRHRESFLAKPLTRFINVDAKRGTAIVNTFGYGMYRFRYGDVAGVRAGHETRGGR